MGNGFTTVRCSSRLTVQIHGLQEVRAVGLNVEANQVRAQQSVYEFSLPGTNTECLRVRPRDMPEDCHARIGARLLNHPGQKREVIILGQQHRTVHALHLLQHRIGEPPVGRLIVLPVGNPKHGASVGNVAERPEPLVGKTVVVAFLFFLAQPDAAQRIARIVGRYAQMIMFVHGLTIRVPTPVRNPCSVTST
jgi:hypothetical protein